MEAVAALIDHPEFGHDAANFEIIVIGKYGQLTDDLSEFRHLQIRRHLVGYE
jgi:hypothetical protein